MGEVIDLERERRARERARQRRDKALREADAATSGPTGALPGGGGDPHGPSDSGQDGGAGSR